MGAGAVGFGLVAGSAGYGGGFAITAALITAVIVPAWWEQAREHPPAPGGTAAGQ